MDSGGYRAYASEDVITGEGVAVELPIASTLLRMGSIVIDLILGVVVLVIVILGVGLLTANVSDAVARSLGLVAVVAVVVGIPTISESLTRGKTLGKVVFGLRVVRDDGGAIGPRHALTRALIGVFEIWTLGGVIALVASLMNGRSKRLGDMAAGTYVITERAKLHLTPPPKMPYALAGWARNADIATIPPGLTVAVRQFLARAPSLGPEVRASIGGTLLADVLQHVAPAPPPGFHGEYVLAAVIAERRQRDGLRLARAEALRRRVLPPDPLRPNPDPLRPNPDPLRPNVPA